MNCCFESLLQTGNWQPVQGPQAHSATLASEGAEGARGGSHTYGFKILLQGCCENEQEKRCGLTFAILLKSCSPYLNSLLFYLWLS